jgi:DNA-binding CsgD family transcriptional regulator
MMTQEAEITQMCAIFGWRIRRAGDNVAVEGSSVVRCRVVVGRAAELAAIDDLIRGIRSGQGAVQVFEGDAGAGKSRLVLAAVDRARQLGIPAAIGRADSTVRVPYRPWTEALIAATRRGGLPDAPGLAAHAAVLGQLVPMWATGGEPVDNSVLAIGEAILAMCDHLAGDDGLLLVLEDLHWADDETLAVVGYVADNIGETTTALILTTRPTPAGASAMGRELASRGSANHHALLPLSQADATEMAHQCLRPSPNDLTAGEVAAVVTRAEGLPLLIEDLLAARRLRPEDDTSAASVPQRFAHTVRQRLATLSDEATAIVEASAVLGSRFDWRLLEPMTTLPAAEVGAALREAVAVQLLVLDSSSGEAAFRHALIADVIVDGLDPIRRRTLHLAAADAVEAASLSGGDREVLRPLEAALRGAAGDAVRAAELLVELARSDLRRGALRSAERHAGAALDLVPGDTRTQLLMLEVLVRSGQVDRALDDGDALLARQTLPVDQRAASELLVARAALAADRLRDSSRHLDSARSAATVSQLAEIASLEAHVALATIESGRLVAAEHLAHRAVAAAEAADVPEMVCESLEVVGRCARLRDLTAAQDAFTRGLHVAEANGLALWRIRALNELGTVDMFRDADPARLLEARRAAVSAGAMSTVAGVDINLAALHTMRGEYDLARTAAESCERIARRCRLDGLVAGGLVFQGVVATHEGRYADMRRHVRAAEEVDGDDPDVIVGTWAMCRGTAALLQENRDEARTAFAKAADAIADRPPLAINPVDGPRLLLRVAIGEATLADVDRYGAHQARGALWSALWEGFARAIVLGANSQPDAAVAAAESAIEAGRQLPLFTAIGLRLVGERAIADGWGRPEEWLRQAESAFDAIGHDRAGAACRDLLRRTGARVPRPRKADSIVPASLRTHGITAREYEVLQLVAERRTNAEIAGRLYLSPRTVEKHVASLLSKAGLRDRKELAALL